MNSDVVAARLDAMINAGVLNVENVRADDGGSIGRLAASVDDGS